MLLTVINFFHGKIVALEDEEYIRALVHRQIFALFDFILNIAIMIALVFMPLYLEDPRGLIIVNLIVRGLDIVLVLMVKRMSKEQAIVHAQNSWLWIDVVIIMCFTAAFFVFAPLEDHKRAISILFLVLIVGDIVTDYSFNARMYFSFAGDWSDMAEMWDEAQGVHGDIYRRRIVLPAIEQAVQIKGKTVLELGCGNGCVSRVLASKGASKVVAIDKFSEMIRVASQYTPQTVQYLQCDIESATGRLSGENFGLAVACFSLQDCASIEAPLRFIKENLAAHGRAIIVYENDAAFDTSSHVTTGRRPLDKQDKTGIGRRWILYWGPKLVYFAQCDRRANDADSFFALAAEQSHRTYTTITRHWSTGAYLKAAAAVGFELATPVRKLHVGNVEPRIAILERYEHKPKFSMLVLRRREDTPQVDENDPPVVLILIAGTSGSGKSRLANYLVENCSGFQVLDLDEFYRDYNDPGVPLKGRKPDWESIKSVHIDAVQNAIQALLQRRDVSIPVYDMASSKRVHTRIVTGSDIRALVVHGLFAFDVFSPDAKTVRILLNCPPLTRAKRRIKRDVYERRRNWPQAVMHAFRLWLRKDKRYAKENGKPLANYSYSTDMPVNRLFDRVIADLKSEIPDLG